MNTYRDLTLEEDDFEDITSNANAVRLYRTVDKEVSRRIRERPNLLTPYKDPERERKRKIYSLDKEGNPLSAGDVDISDWVIAPGTEFELIGKIASSGRVESKAYKRIFKDGIRAVFTPKNFRTIPSEKLAQLEKTFTEGLQTYFGEADGWSRVIEGDGLYYQLNLGERIIQETYVDGEKRQRRENIEGTLWVSVLAEVTYPSVFRRLFSFGK